MDKLTRDELIDSAISRATLLRRRVNRLRKAARFAFGGRTQFFAELDLLVRSFDLIIRQLERQR